MNSTKSLTRIAIVAAIMGVAGVMMYITLPLAAIIIGGIDALFFAFVGPSFDEIAAAHLVPLAITYFIYVAVAAVLYLILTRGDDSGSNRSDGVMSFSSRGGRVTWVPRSSSKGGEENQ